MIAILDESTQLAIGLAESLQDERHALEQQDTDALQVALTTKGVCVNGMQALENRRTELCDASGFSTGPQQMEQFLSWCDENSIIARRWTRLLEIAANCNALNLTNGAIVQARRQMIEGNLAVIRGAEALPDTYRREGNETAAMARHSLARA